MKKFLALVLTGALALSMVGCGSASEGVTGKASANGATVEEVKIEAEGSNPAENSGEATTKTIVDHEGTTVEIPAEIDRIVVGTWPLAAQLAAYLGSAEKIVGVAPEVMVAAEHGVLGQIYPEFLNASTKFYEGGTINIEELLKLEPDIVIGVSGETAAAIREAGIPAVSVSVSQWGYDVVETTGQWLDVFDGIFGESEKAAKVQAHTEQVQADILAKVSTLSEEEKKRVMILFSYSDAAMKTSSKGFFGQSWCDLTGAINVGEEIDALGAASINMEQVYAWNPDVIMITNFTSAQPEDLYNNTIGSDDWSTVKAVQDKEVYKMPLGWYRSFTPGVDTAVTLQWFAKMVYPELFADVDMNQVTKDYFNEYFGITLTDEQIEMMYNPSSAASAY